jgi:hypothetical protein
VHSLSCVIDFKRANRRTYQDGTIRIVNYVDTSWRVKMNDEDLIKGLDYIRNTMIAVATGGPRIQEVNQQYQQMYAEVSATLARRGINNPVIYGNLWDWYGRWSSGDLPSYQSRRIFVAEIINPIINLIRTGRVEELQPTGWQRVDRTAGELRERLATAVNEEQYQAVGLICRETLISLAQAVYVREHHPPVDGVEPSPTDGKRMLEAYIAVEIAGEGNDEARRHARSALDLTNMLQHRRTATFRDAALCVEATTSLINVIAIIAGRRDPR